MFHPFLSEIGTFPPPWGPVNPLTCDYQLCFFDQSHELAAALDFWSDPKCSSKNSSWTWTHFYRIFSLSLLKIILLRSGGTSKQNQSWEAPPSCSCLWNTAASAPSQSNARWAANAAYEALLTVLTEHTPGAPECRLRKPRPHLLFPVGFYFYFICNLLREVGSIISSQHLHKSNTTVRSLVMCTDKHSRKPFRDNRNYQGKANISVAFFTLVASVTFL